MARPIVDGVERDLGDAVRVIRLNRHTPAGRAITARLGLHLVPSFVVFDGQGEVRLRKDGIVIKQQPVLEALGHE
ncbi:MAG: hypothetical protein F4X83_08995 [Chloroflexi bacterium]|nr:hypothetical protein [Chloroflexota bacterium]